ncbi:porin [Azohydromonas lata]|uniref:Porin n=1 Tax=Azohydromonas lata TaxID=45677 RepID=A0ABU5IH75_9BURK|nr:porin [Azohydromonas lata]MDZ5458492.1 porin [Azohydromonas lata]
MNKSAFTAAVLAAGAGAASAQTGVSLFGLVDAYVESARIAGQPTVNRVSSGGSAASRWGLRGGEDLGGGLNAHFVIENGFAPDTGAALQGGRLFGRQAWVGLASATAGEIRLGRQYAPIHYSMQGSDIDAFSAFSPVFAMYLSNGEQSRQDNQVSWWTPKLAGFSGAVSVAAGENAAVAPGPTTGWIPAAGTARRSLGALLRWQSGDLDASAAFHQGGQALAAGEAEQQAFNLGAMWRAGGVQVGGNYWSHRNELPSAATARTQGFALGVRVPVAGALSLVAQVAQVRDNGHAYATGAVKAEGRTNHLNVGASYALSRRTELYLRHARVQDRSGGYNGRANAALLGAFGANSALPPDGSARTLGVGLRHSF